MPSMYILSNVILELALSSDGLPHLSWTKQGKMLQFATIYHITYNIHILDMGNNMIRLTIFIHVLFAKKNGGI